MSSSPYKSVSYPRDFSGYPSDFVLLRRLNADGWAQARNDKSVFPLTPCGNDEHGGMTASLFTQRNPLSQRIHRQIHLRQ